MPRDASLLSEDVTFVLTFQVCRVRIVQRSP